MPRRSTSTVIDFEHGLNTCIRQIRQALGDDRAGARFIETVPRLGYRFIAETLATARARASIERALQIDGTLPEAYLAAAKLHMTERDWLSAGRDYRRAIELAPKHALVRQQYALWLSYQERFEDALKEARLAESFDPLSLEAAPSLPKSFARRADSTKQCCRRGTCWH